MGAVTSRDGTHIGFTRTGQGPALILVDGAMCFRNFGPMEGLAALLNQQFTVYTYDRRGRGESGDTQPYAVERELEDIEALVTEAGGAAFIYGISSGAALALLATAQLPAIKKVAAYEAPFGVDSSRTLVVENYLPQLTELLAADRRGDAVELFMRLVGTPAEMVAGMRQSPVWPTFESIAPTLRYDGTIVDNPQEGQSLPSTFAGQLSDIKAPALVMAGGASPDWMRNAAQTIAKAIPDAQYRTLAGQTHELQSEVVAPILIEFFTN